MKSVRNSLVVAAVLVVSLFSLLSSSSGVTAQDATPAVAATPISCDVPAKTLPEIPAATPQVASPASDELVHVKFGYTPVSIFAPLMIAEDKGYFAEQGVDVELVPFPGGSDPVVLTSSGDLDMAIAGAGPAFWNAMAQDLGITVVSPGHMEGDPVATPLMISVAKCQSGDITSIADLKGKKVSVNARGATEYWLDQALRSGGLTINDIDLQQLSFPDAVAALESGAVDAAMVGEPLATKAEMDGIALRLATSFAVQDIQPTLVFANDQFLADNPEVATAVVAGYLKAAQELTNGGFDDPANLAIIEKYTGVPASLIAVSVKPIYSADGTFDIDGLNKLQQFFRDRGLLEYDTNIDPATLIDQKYVDQALTKLNPNSP